MNYQILIQYVWVSADQNANRIAYSTMYGICGVYKIVLGSNPWVYQSPRFDAKFFLFLRGAPPFLIGIIALISCFVHLIVFGVIYRALMTALITILLTPLRQYIVYADLCTRKRFNHPLFSKPAVRLPLRKFWKSSKTFFRSSLSMLVFKK